MRKKLLVILYAIMLMLTACANEKNNTVDNSSSDVVETTAEQDTVEDNVAESNIAQDSTFEAVEITDQAGRTVKIEKIPEHIVSSYYITSSMLIALGLEDKIVGIEDNPQKRAIYGLSCPKLLELPTVGSVKAFDIEACVALEPDLVILPMKLKETATTLEELGITVIVVNPESSELLSEMISIVGQATGTLERADSLNDFIASKTKLLDDINSTTEPVSVYLGGNSSFLLTAGKSMYQSEMIKLGGGANVADEIDDTYWAETSYEQILSWNPEYIILASSAEYTVDDILSDPNIAECDAVKNGNVYHIPDGVESWDSPVPGAFLGSVWLESIIHSDLFSEDDFNEIFGEYYETFYNFKANE